MIGKTYRNINLLCFIMYHVSLFRSSHVGGVSVRIKVNLFVFFVYKSLVSG